MPREIVTIQVGQCGNQVGCRFWDLILREHAQYNPKGLFNESMSTFFRNVDSRYDDPAEIPLGDGTNRIRTLKARAVLVDMEEGVLNELLTGSLGDLFDSRHLVKDVSGSGNNWAHGHKVYGPTYSSELIDRIRHSAEVCDSLQSFWMMHSLGGGTGSGLGTYILSLLEDEFPEVYRFSTCLFPSEDDDVITSPYNSVLALKELTEHADCVLPMENQALVDIVNSVPENVRSRKGTSRAFSITDSTLGTKRGGRSSAFDSMNEVAAHLLTNLTASIRFEGDLNMDLNEITMNLVPFPKLHYLVPSISPVWMLKDVGLPKSKITEVLHNAFSPKYQLTQVAPMQHTYLACGLVTRGGDLSISDVHSSLVKLRSSLKMPYWNEEAFKVSLCRRSPIGIPYSIVSVANNTCIASVFRRMASHFQKLYRRKAHVHHYTQYMDAGVFDEAHESIRDLIAGYERFDNEDELTVTRSERPDIEF